MKNYYFFLSEGLKELYGVLGVIDMLKTKINKEELKRRCVNVQTICMRLLFLVSHHIMNEIFQKKSLEPFFETQKETEIGLAINLDICYTEEPNLKTCNLSFCWKTKVCVWRSSELKLNTKSNIFRQNKKLNLCDYRNKDKTKTKFLQLKDCQKFLNYRIRLIQKLTELKVLNPNYDWKDKWKGILKQRHYKKKNFIKIVTLLILSFYGKIEENVVDCLRVKFFK